jgi:thiol-disulfide isomerase/thioredoxin
LRILITEPAEKPRMFNFWATWCGPCRAEMPVLRQFALDHPEVEVVLVNVDMPAMRSTHVEPFLERLQVTALRSVQLDDPDPAAALPSVVDGWPDTIPVTLIVRADGTRARQIDGAVSRALLDAGLAQAL